MSETWNPRGKTLRRTALAFNRILAELLNFDTLNSYSFDEDADRESEA